MIMKKMQVLEDFPALGTLKELSRFAGDFSEFSPAFYDIETTGLSRSGSWIYLIGAVSYEEKGWILRQWFAGSRQEEKELLSAFGDFLEGFSCTVQYNGDAFDQPFVTARCQACGLTDIFGGRPSLDLYKALRCLKGLLGAAGMKQPELEAVLGLEPRSFCDGREAIRRYREYLKNPLPQLAKEVLGHNREDLTGLLQVYRLLSCLALFQGDFTPLKAEYQPEELLAVIGLPFGLPAAVSVSLPGFQLRGVGREVRLLIASKEGRLRRFYENYRDYVYLPGEDMAVHRRLSAFMEKSLYVPARRETCYTWFSVNESFLTDPAAQKTYLQSALGYYLHRI